jgi:hypothetical protein
LTAMLGGAHPMPHYEYGHVRTLAAKLDEAAIAPEIAGKILEGGEAIRRRDKPEKKAEWMRLAMDRMDSLLDEPTRHAVRETCACYLGGKRLEISRGIARDHAALEDRIRAANDAKFVFGHSVTVQDDGRILVRFFPEGLEEYRCVCLRGAKKPVSITYCYCCGGHAKHHLQTALGLKLSCTVRSSALASGGREPCTFLFSIEE